MDEQTLAYYQDHAAELAARYRDTDRAHIRTTLGRWLKNGDRVLEIGCGSGCDANYMAGLGCTVLGIDASNGMLAQVPENWRESATFQHGAFPLSDNDPLLHERFDAIVATAVLMHVPDSDLFQFAYQIRTMLKMGGRFICSFPTGQVRTDEDARLYVPREPDQVQLLFERLGFRLVDSETNPDGLGRRFTWSTLILAYEGTSIIRPLDQIESIMNRDRNTATYKLALLRALCDIAQTSFNHAMWHPNGEVSIPLGLVVEKWLYYYWPLIQAPIYLPEMRTGVRAGGVAFRSAMEALIESCKPGGMDAFHSSFLAGQLTTEQLPLLGASADNIANAIIRGPIVYAGGSLGSTEPVFRYVGRRTRRVFHHPIDLVQGFGDIYVPASLWREMCLVGHWISEAIVLRWARLSRNFANQSVSLADVITLLLARPESERGVQSARAVYSELADLECVWTGRPLRRTGFDVDHVIPFSFWPNNYLWNLLPASPAVNNQKRDKVVAWTGLQASRDRIIHYWSAAQAALPARFKSELEQSLLGSRMTDRNWEVPAFSKLVEANEIIAVQRGALRWDAARN